MEGEATCASGGEHILVGAEGVIVLVIWAVYGLLIVCKGYSLYVDKLVLSQM